MWSKKWYKNLIAFSIENPFKTWWKARKYFKFPNIKMGISVSPYSFPYASSYWRGKILDICIHDVYWKEKERGRICHENNPLIYICLFSRINIGIIFTKTYKDEFNQETDGSWVYWEYLLKYLYNGKNLTCYSNWSGDSKLYKYTIFGDTEDGSKDITKPFSAVIPCVAMSLNKRGISQLKKLIKNS